MTRKRPPVARPRHASHRTYTAAPFPQAGGPEDPQGLTRWALAFLASIEVRGFSAKTAETRKYQLARFLRWCIERDIQRPQEVTLSVIERYQRQVFTHPKSNGHPYSISAQHSQLSGIKQFFRFLARQHVMLTNPAADLELPKLPHRLPMNSLSAEQAERVLQQPDVATPLGVRDRAMLEVLYSTGIRRGELCGLEVGHVGFEQGVLWVHGGKGNKDRVVPIGSRALAWVNKYLKEVRPLYVLEGQPRALFLSYTGEPLGEIFFGHLVHEYIESSGVGKQGACHLFRHTFATLMLENGADVRYIQAMLGHASLETTQIYTQVSIAKLKQVHAATHPAQLGRPMALHNEFHTESVATSAESTDKQD